MEEDEASPSLFGSGAGSSAPPDDILEVDGGRWLVSCPRPRSLLQRYYRTYLVKDNGGPGEDYLVHIHTNRSMITTLAPSHALVRALREALVASSSSSSSASSNEVEMASAVTEDGAEAKQPQQPLFLVSWAWRHSVSSLIPRTTARGNPTLLPGEVGAKRQRSTAPKNQCVQKDSILATAITSDGRVWPIRSGVKGYPVEINSQFSPILTVPVATTAGERPQHAQGGEKSAAEKQAEKKKEPSTAAASASGAGGASGAPGTGKGWRPQGRWGNKPAPAAKPPAPVESAPTAAAVASTAETAPSSADAAPAASSATTEAPAPPASAGDSAAAAAAAEPKGMSNRQKRAMAPPTRVPPSPAQQALTALLRDRPHSDAFVALFTHPNRHKAASMPFEAPGELIPDIDTYAASAVAPATVTTD